MITFVEEEVNAHLTDRRIIKNWIKQVAASYKFKLGDICYIFCNDEKILATNIEFLQHDYYTDIITFDYVEDDVLSGDMFISVDTVKSNSEQFSGSYEDELHRVVIHGILHLCGFKDKSPEDENSMRAAEDKALKLLSRLKAEK